MSITIADTVGRSNGRLRQRRSSLETALPAQRAVWYPARCRRSSRSLNDWMPALPAADKPACSIKFRFSGGCGRCGIINILIQLATPLYLFSSYRYHKHDA
ncbi:hypothetical protein KCP77_22180 [Salmonella enterica subsp. enterica]|nr:hypothetical protein KCP77_22180 [Salmonella enterica subsp. enterica]